jgi:hypothetical protein
MALPTASTLPAVPTGISTADPEVQKQYSESIDKVLSALENRGGTNWFQIAGALANPGRTGSASEAFGRAMDVVGQQRQVEEQNALPVAQMRAQLVGQKYEMGKEAQALNAFAKVLGTTPQDLQSGISQAQNNPAMMQRLNAAMPMFYGSPKITEMAKTMFGQYKDMANTLLEEFKAGMTQADLVAKYGNEILPMIRGMGGIQPGSAAPSGAPAASGSPINVPYTTGEVAVAADANNPSGIKPGGKFAIFKTPEEGVQATQQLVDSYLSNPSRNTPASLVGTWVNGKPDTGATVQNGAYVSGIRKELDAAGIELDKDGRIPNTPEANAAVTRAIITHESGPERAKPFLPLVGTEFKPTAAPAATAPAGTIRTATEALGSPKIEADRIIAPDGEVLAERGASSLADWSKLKENTITEYNKRKAETVKFEREQISNASKERAESFAPRIKEVGTINPDDILRTQGMYDSLDNLVNSDPDMKKALGLMMKQGAGAAMYELAKNGVKINNFGIGVDAYPAFVKQLPTDKQEKLRQMDMILSNIFTQKAKDGKSAFGPNISNFDILTQKETMASIRDTAKIINGWLSQERTLADQKLDIAGAFGDFVTSTEGTNKKPYQFFTSQEYKDIAKKYGQLYRDLAIVTYGAPK